MADLGLSDYARGPSQLLGSLRALCAPGPHRSRRIAAGRALSADGPDGAACLESLAGRHRITRLARRLARESTGYAVP